MGDLQCPARVFVLGSGPGLTSDELARLLRAERIAAVYAGRSGHLEQTGRELASALGAVFSGEPGLTQADPVPTGDDARHVFGHIADRHRGEAVLVMAEPDVLRPVVGAAGGTGDRIVALEADADGWRVVSHLPTSASGCQ